MENMYKHKVLTSTSALGGFIYDGLNETFLGSIMSTVAPDMRYDAENEVGKLAVERIECALRKHMGNNEFSVEYVETYHPRYYNYETDYVLFDLAYSDAWKIYMLSYVERRDDLFVKYLVNNFSSRDGYISFTPTNWSDWLVGWNDDDWRCVSALIRFFINQEIGDKDSERLNDDFTYAAYDIISNRYISSEYAERYDNGFISVVVGDYDRDIDCDYYDAYLLNANGKLVNSVRFVDDDDCGLFGSAYAAWNNTRIRFDLFEDDTAIHGVQCDVPNGFMDSLNK